MSKAIINGVYRASAQVYTVGKRYWVLRCLPSIKAIFLRKPYSNSRLKFEDNFSLSLFTARVVWPLPVQAASGIGDNVRTSHYGFSFIKLAPISMADEVVLLVQDPRN